MLALMSRVHDGRAMAEHTISEEIEAMECGGRFTCFETINSPQLTDFTTDVLPIYVAAQNAAIILRRPLRDKTILTVESFEVAPKDLDITHTEGIICIVCPSVGPLSLPFDPTVRKSLAQFIVYHERHIITITQDRKGTAKQYVQDTRSPRLITELLTGTIRGFSANPAERQKETVFVSKRVDSPVLCSQDSGVSWRRGPIWLVIRIALQTTLHERQTNERVGYKAFVLRILSYLLEASLKSQPKHLLSV